VPLPRHRPIPAALLQLLGVKAAAGRGRSAAAGPAPAAAAPPLPPVPPAQVVPPAPFPNPGYPGTGLKPGEVEPFVTIEKDGYIETACVKDYMLQYGDKFGGNKHEYEMGSHGVSIVRYADIVPKEDRDDMTREVCFEFCRTLPNMTVFGLAHGRDCYCAPFYQAEAGDSSQCDSVCEGDKGNMCGGMYKSSIFTMHLCEGTGKELASAVEAAKSILEPLEHFLTETKEVYVDGLQASAASLQKIFGVGGDPAAGDLLQTAKVAAGEVERKHKALTDFKAKIGELVGKAEALGEVGDDAAKVKEADELSAAIQQTLKEGEAMYKETEAMLYSDLDSSPASLNQYKPITYFVDRKEVDAPSTCSGSTLGIPVTGATVEECAAACDEKVDTCVGFSFFPSPDGPALCFLLSTLRSSTYFVKCGDREFTNFMQAMKKKQGPGAEKTNTKCYAKFQQFEGLALNPDPSGKCQHCLKALTKADRCFYYEH